MRTRIHDFVGDAYVIAVSSDTAPTGDFTAINFALSLRELINLREQIDDVVAAYRLRERVK